MVIDSLISENLKQLMRQKGLNSSELARQVGVKQPIVQRLLTGENENPTLATLRLFSNFFNISVGQLIGEISLTQHWLNQDYSHENLYSVPLLQGTVNLKSQDCIMVDCPLSKKAFAMKVIYKTMEPAIPKDAIIVIEPNLKPSNKDFVVIKKNDEFILQVYLAKGNSKLLLSSLHGLDIMEVVPGIDIFGTVVRVIYGKKLPDRS